MMKKIMLFAAACVALAACSKEIDTTTPAIGNGTAFEQGQTVTLTVNTGDQTKVTSSLDSSTGAVDFKWETGDKIKVTVGTESAEFTLKTGAGESTATFEGTMPAAGETFAVQYPVADPDLSSQTYVANGLPKDKMKMAATGCTLGSDFTLNPQNAALRLNLYGLNREVSSIVVTNTTADPNVSYTLNCSSAVRVGNSAETATPFLIVIPAGASEWNFKVEVTAGNATANPDPVPTYTEGSYNGNGIVITSGTFITTSAQTFTAGQILNMPAKLISTVWAPVNCGYDATNYKYGKLYQWGRKIGSGYNDGSTYTEPAQEVTTATFDADGYNKTPADDKFYKNSTNPRDWYANATDKQLTAWPMKSGDAGYVEGKIANPCPAGWRVPTWSELDKLAGGDGTGNASLDGSGWDSTNKGYWFNGTTSPSVGAGLFLPAAGYRYYYNGSADKRGDYGYYWSSSVDGNKATYLRFSNGIAVMNSSNRASGYSVRCVQE